MPLEIILRILSYLDTGSLFCISFVNKYFHELSNSKCVSLVFSRPFFFLCFSQSLKKIKINQNNFFLTLMSLQCHVVSVLHPWTYQKEESRPTRPDDTCPRYGGCAGEAKGILEKHVLQRNYWPELEQVENETTTHWPFFRNAASYRGSHKVRDCGFFWFQFIWDFTNVMCKS